MLDSDLLRDMASTLAATIDPVSYLSSLGFESYPWQREVLGKHDRLILKCPRQSGKSTIIAAKTGHKCKHHANSLVMLFAPTENQAVELMEKIGLILSQDPEITLVRDSTIEKRFSNGSRIRAFTANPTSARGYSDPDMIIFDEAAYVDDELYLTVRPMMTGGKTELILLSTPHGKTGFFHDTWTRPNPAWKKIQVDVPDIMHEADPREYPEIDVASRERELKAEGIDAFLSPRHSLRFLREEFGIMGEHWYRQEYGGEFLDPQDNVFDFNAVLATLSDDEEAIDLDGLSLEVDQDSAVMGW